VTSAVRPLRLGLALGAEARWPGITREFERKPPSVHRFDCVECGESEDWACDECGCCSECCECDDALFDADELGLDPETDIRGR